MPWEWEHFLFFLNVSLSLSLSVLLSLSLYIENRWLIERIAGASLHTTKKKKS